MCGASNHHSPDREQPESGACVCGEVCVWWEVYVCVVGGMRVRGGITKN